MAAPFPSTRNSSMTIMMMDLVSMMMVATLPRALSLESKIYSLQLKGRRAEYGPNLSITQNVPNVSMSEN